MNDGEMWDRFCSGLKYEVRLEVMKSNVATFEEAAKISLRVDSALWTMGKQGESSGRWNKATRINGVGVAQGTTPLEMGNVEQRGRRPKMEGKCLKGYQRNVCFTCDKVGCRPWKHRGNATANNFEVEGIQWDDIPEEQNADLEN